MNKAKNILIAGTVMPALLLAQIGVGSAELAPGATRVAQAGEPKAGEKEKHTPKGPAAGQPPGAKTEKASPPHEPAKVASPAAPAAAAPPKAPVPMTPKAPAPTAPKTPMAPMAPKTMAPPTPKPGSATPMAPKPLTPMAPAPMAPKAQAPMAPVAPTPMAPKAQAPMVPKPQTPAAAKPQGAMAPTPPAAAPTPVPPPAAAAAKPVPAPASQPATPATPPAAAVQKPAPAANGTQQPPVASAPTSPAQPQARPMQGQGGQGRPVQGQGAPQGQAAPQGQGQAQQGQRPQQGQNQGQNQGGISPGGAVAIGAAAGFVGGFLAATGARGIDDIRRDRREDNENGVDYIREPGRTIVRDGDRVYVVHDENERFRDLGLGIRTEQRGGESVAIFDRPGGEQILTFTDNDGRLLRRVRRFRDGREVVIIDNGVDGRIRDYRDDIVDLPEEPLRIPRDRFIVNADGADETVLYETLTAPPVAPLAQRYTLDQVRYSPDLRARMRSIDVDSLNFDPGSWTVPPDQTAKLQTLGDAVKKAVARNPNEVFMVEGYTDATGNPTDNLSLSDRRAQAVATILTQDFGVPPENLTTQGYGQQYLKEQTQGSSRINRRVTLRRITPLLATGGTPPR